MHDLTAFHDGRSPNEFVEGRTHVGGRDVRLSIYDTYPPAQPVSLHAPHLMICGMISGRKTIHVEGADVPFDVVPGESVVVPAGQRVHIDFPDVRKDAPTTWITLEIEQATVRKVIDRLDETPPCSPTSEVSEKYIHISNTSSLERILGTLVALFAEDHPYRDALIDMNGSELVLRMLRTDARSLLMERRDSHASGHGMAAAVQHVNDHLDRHLPVDELAEVACMGRSTFYRKFRDEFGVTPLQYVHQRRMRRAQSLLRKGDRTVTDVSLAVGYRSVSHFITRFKQSVGVTPKAYQERLQGEG